MDYRKIVKEVGRGKNRAVLAIWIRETATCVVHACSMATCRIWKMGGILIALRIKGKVRRRCAVFMRPCSRERCV